MDPEILSILGYPGQSRVVPQGLSQFLIRENFPQYLVSRDTSGCSQVVPDIIQGKHSHSPILSILGNPSTFVANPALLIEVILCLLAARQWVETLDSILAI